MAHAWTDIASGLFGIQPRIVPAIMDELGFTALALSIRISYENGHLTSLHLMLQEQPVQFGYFAVLAALCWIGYFVIRRRLRASGSI